MPMSEKMAGWHKDCTLWPGTKPVCCAPVLLSRMKMGVRWKPFSAATFLNRLRGGLAMAGLLTVVARTARADDGKVLNIYHWSDYVGDDTIANRPGRHEPKSSWAPGDISPQGRLFPRRDE